MRISDWSSDVCSSDLCCCGWPSGSISIRACCQAASRVAAATRYDGGWPIRCSPISRSIVPKWKNGWRQPPAAPRRLRAPMTGSDRVRRQRRSEEHTSELQSLMRISYAVFCLKKKKKSERTEEIPRGKRLTQETIEKSIKATVKHTSHLTDRKQHSKHEEPDTQQCECSKSNTTNDKIIQNIRSSIRKKR